MDRPKLSYGAETLLFEATEKHCEGRGLSRREFLAKCTITVAGTVFLSIPLNTAGPGASSAAADCSCFTACYVNCHSDCGRKMW
jgi:hypothetical protein